MAISGPEEVLYGQSKIYKLTVANPGNGDTENVTVGLLPIGRAAESAANHRLGTLKAGESKTIDIELTARQAGAVSIKAQAFADNGLRSRGRRAGAGPPREPEGRSRGPQGQIRRHGRHLSRESH